MIQRDLLLKLAKLVVAASWADGKLEVSEINVLKDLIFSFDDLDERDWQTLDLYIESPVSEAECNELLQDLIDAVASEADKAVVMDKLRELVEADGIVTEDESRLLAEVKSCLDNKKTGLLTFLSSLSGIGRQRRSSRFNREERIDDFIKNRVYFNILTEHAASVAVTEMPEDAMRRLCLYSSLFAFVAKGDEVISDEEKTAITQVIQTAYGLTDELASIVCAASLQLVQKNTDKYEITRSVYQQTSYPERVTLVKVLFQIANACDKTSNDEINTISQIADLLRLQRTDFIAAKFCIAKEDRKGL
ncbi:TerB family tellurite resistance protein [Cerasicoccus arenae]|uniref:Co-chaperone DjlA N-terminal domain-containing protein n=2 Tax=Cerasicoccus arenae TaxID=424488 RepID=A0A8J3DE39_9BACT|nr:TerB family tellurite resistance protein [Cerasicoccus arenae]GHB95665.1 hypothetical protein GCM10007047_09370 [Cerasicoccus arenae]